MRPVRDGDTPVTDTQSYFQHFSIGAYLTCGFPYYTIGPDDGDRPFFVLLNQPKLSPVAFVSFLALWKSVGYFCCRGSAYVHEIKYYCCCLD